MPDSFNRDLDLLRFCKEVLEIARFHGVEEEVVVTALQTVREDPDSPLSEALLVGMNEWVK